MGSRGATTRTSRRRIPTRNSRGRVRAKRRSSRTPGMCCSTIATPITAQVGKIRFEEAAEDLLNDYRTNKKRSLRTITHRIEKHLKPFFGGRRMTAIGTALARVFVDRRQTAGASNAEINRELIALKRMFTLAVQGGKLMTRPYLPLLKENNIRKGFFEPAQFTSVKNHLPAHMQPIVEFANITGWRTPSEILPLERRPGSTSCLP